jgi:hypothetical protein
VAEIYVAVVIKSMEGLRIDWDSGIVGFVETEEKSGLVGIKHSFTLSKKDSGDYHNTSHYRNRSSVRLWTLF